MAVMYRSHYKCVNIITPPSETFEFSWLHLVEHSYTVDCL